MQLGHSAPMLTIPPRIIAHVFSSETYSHVQLSNLRMRLERACEEEGRSLVDLVIDRGPARENPARHQSLQRIARGDADGILIMRLPLTLQPNKSRDVLGRHLDGPLRFLSKAELAELGLLPKVVEHPPHRTLADAAHFAGKLRNAGLSLRAIASHLEAEGFCTARGTKWYAATVAELLSRGSETPADTDAESPAVH